MRTPRCICETVLKLIGHRGWSAGGDENTLVAFSRAAHDSRLSGVELDICVGANSEKLVVSHDTSPRRKAALTLDVALTVDAALLFLSKSDLELFVEIKEVGLAPAVIEKLVAASIPDRSVVFGFAGVARSFPWKPARPVRLGIIVRYPWNIGRMLRAYAPDFILLGWDEREWTRIAFQAWWSVFSLKRLATRCPAAVVVGIVRRAADIRWLSRQHIYGVIADMDPIDAACAIPDPDARR
jgi:hypothetical protein